MFVSYKGICIISVSSSKKKKVKMGHSLPRATAQLLILAFTTDLRNYSVFKKGAHPRLKNG